MAKRRWHPSYCYVCGESGTPTRPISARGRCPNCGDRREVENMRQLAAHAGPFFDHWRRRSLAALGVVVVDEQAESR